jgi:hypothetical protein
MKVSDPASYMEAMDELMSSEWGKSFPAVVAVMPMTLTVMMMQLIQSS